MRTGSGAISANFLGSVVGAETDGKATFYKAVEVLGGLKVGNKHVFRASGLSDIGTDLQVSGTIAATGSIYSLGEPCLTNVEAYTKSETYSKQQADASYQPKWDNIISPLRIGFNALTGKTELSINPLAALSISSINTSTISSLNRLTFTSDTGVPTNTTRSPGVKILLYDALSSTIGDYAIGVEPFSMFLQIP